MKPIIRSAFANRENYLADTPVDKTALKHWLVDNLGFYCSYCEIPLSGHEVEHHTYYKAWQSQIRAKDLDHLLLICKDCRDHITKEELSQEEHDNMLWPDKDVTFALHAKSPFTYEQRTVRHIVLHEDDIHLNEEKNLVFVAPNPLAGEETYRKAKNTIDHFQLNMQKEYYNDASNTLIMPLDHYQQHIDNRTFERTKTWAEAVAAMERLQQLETQLEGTSLTMVREHLLDQISTTAYFKGNWSVWMTVFNNYIPNNHPLLHRLFISDTRYFKNIDTEKLGLNFKP